MQKSIVITGVNGFVGRHLAAELKKQSIQAIGVGREESCDFVPEYSAADLGKMWPQLQTDPDAIIHLAGLAIVGPSFDNPQDYININSAMITHMCEHYLKQDKKPRIIIVSSGTIYDPLQPMPLNEEAKIALSSPYAVSKVLVENQAEYYRQRGLDCVVVRPFNHIGPGQMSGFIVPDFAQKILSAPEGSTVSVGNVETKRDYTDVRDIVRAYASLATAESLGQTVYNICSSRSLSGKEIFALLQDALNRHDVHYEIDPSLVRPTDISEIVGDASRIGSELGWHPEIAIEQTMRDIVESLT